MSEHVGGDSPNTQRQPPGRTTNRKTRAKAPAQTAAPIDPPPAGAKAKRKRRSKAQLAAAKAAKTRALALKTGKTPTAAVRANGKGPPELIAAMFQKIPVVGAKWDEEDAALFLETLAQNMKLEYGFKGSIGVTVTA
jgi:hypothetical protein